MKIQSTMKIRSAIFCLCVVLAASRALRGDLVTTMDSVTDLAKSLGRLGMELQKNDSSHTAQMTTLHNKTRTEMGDRTPGSKAARNSLRIKDMTCDVEMCRALQQAKCDAKCEIERTAKQHQVMETNGTAGLSVARRDAQGGSLHANAHVFQTWSGMYATHLAYIKDCFGYTVGIEPELERWQARIQSSKGSTKTFEVEHGRERHAICYAISYIGTIEDKSKQACRNYQSLRQNLCPECCRSTASGTGCTGSCSP